MTSNLDLGKRNQDRMATIDEDMPDRISLIDATVPTPRPEYKDDLTEHMERDFEESEIEHGTELQRALRDVERSNRELEVAFDHLRDKVDIGTRRMERVLYRAQAPVRFARENPIVLAPALFVGALLLGKFIASAYFEAA